MIFALHGGNLPDFSKRHPRWTRRVLSRADVLVAPSEFLSRELRHLGLSVRVVRNIIDLADYPFKIRRALSPRLIWMRAFHSIYDPRMAVNVLMALRRSHPQASLVMAGVDKGLENEIKSLARNMGLNGAVKFPGFLGKDSKKLEFSQSDIYINTTKLDNTPVAVLEACAMGLPVVATCVGGLPDMISNGINGILVPEGDVEAMVDGLNTLLSNGDLSEHLSRNGRFLAEQHAWDSVRNDWKALLGEIVQRNKRLTGVSTPLGRATST